MTGRTGSRPGSVASQRTDPEANPGRYHLVIPFSFISHTADTGVEATSPSLVGLIAELAEGMFQLVARSAGDGGEEFVMRETAPSPEDLVIAALSELLYLAEVNDVHLHDFQAEQVGPETISVSARGIATTEVEPMGPPIKAVTYHDLRVEQREDGWFGRVYFDV